MNKSTNFEYYGFSFEHFDVFILLNKKKFKFERSRKKIKRKKINILISL
jgi:hypothetical protein